ncbi:putative Actin, gamma-enteric smooth muscle [Monocercomonoides exilis]|uniref:putative Actin, gamma-enteric smooth muscle n=1 Tax=Monocercomonoides exilis TaxID=2049356 RepID=UPI003559B8B7|nr:putative Actin, gamma-enteric smooth muscle [Monocercomonoides exilis]|eukprot:MONOS_1046.1-p1 / transcript=MONOS_1046.1 / gene=MONOS_1046 / organism=Monocercomonoides_exilis_PA203 / gene_product=Williams Beuren syndrome chromosome region 22 / transcript_product=Williams Beuren syndrome chromosome region 22 / location=Mono_scaffold00017:229568-231440(+) / protein_length=311 / sequence_SO=supercontig / SO=protein_coding / is_pseudo=false
MKAIITRIIHIQRKIALRALELLALPPKMPALILDVGCGSGLSGEVLDELPHVHWVGIDISSHMLAIAKERETGGDFARSDIGEGVPFKPGSFDGIISISTIQWLFNADFKDANPRRRLKMFFQTLNHCLVKGGRAVLQFYPASHEQVRDLHQAAISAGFGGGMLCDYPNSTRQKKWYFVLFSGTAKYDFKMPEALMDGASDSDSEEDEEDEEDDDEEEDDDDDDESDGSSEKWEEDDIASLGKKKSRRSHSDAPSSVQFEWKRETFSGRDKRNKRISSREKVKKRKERQRRMGKKTRPDTKYTGRRRTHW